MFPSVTLSQTSSTLHLSQDFYISGDILFYKVYLPQDLKNEEAVFDVSLINSSSVVVARYFQKNELNKNLFGSIKIPVDINSGIYQLIISGTDAKSNEQIRIVECSIPIYSDLKADLTISSSEPVSGVIASAAKDGLIFIEVDVDSIFTTREKVDVKIKIKDSAGLPIQADHSVTIRQVTPQGLNYRSVRHFSLAALPSLLDKIRLSGKIKDENGQQRTFPVMGIYIKKQDKLQLFQTNDKGDFIIELDQFYGDQTIQFLDYLHTDIEVDLEEARYAEASESLILTDELIQYLKLSRKRKKINQLFNTQKEVVMTEFENRQTEKLEGDRVFILEQYESFKNMRTMFVELVTALQFKTDEDGNLYARVFNRDPAAREYYPSKPLFIIDGIVTNDATLVNGLDMNYINRIDLFSDYARLKKHFGPLGLGGVIVIETSIPSIRLAESRMNDIFTINGLRRFEDIIHSFSFEDIDAAYFDPHVYWSPMNTTNTDGEFEFSFSLGDSHGHFLVEVVAQDDKNNVSTIKKFFQIK